MTKAEFVKDFDNFFKSLDRDEKLELFFDAQNNEFISCDDYLYMMNDFNDFFYDKSPLEIVSLIRNTFYENDDYFAFDGYGFANSYDRNKAAEYAEMFTDDILEFLEQYDAFDDYSFIPEFDDEIEEETEEEEE